MSPAGIHASECSSTMKPWSSASMRRLFKWMRGWSWVGNKELEKGTLEPPLQFNFVMEVGKGLSPIFSDLIKTEVGGCLR